MGCRQAGRWGPLISFPSAVLRVNSPRRQIATLDSQWQAG